MKLRTPNWVGILLGLTLSVFPHLAHAVELSQSQMRQLVESQQIKGAETVVSTVSRNFGGQIMDIRGFLVEGRMTYRVLMQNADGQVVEILVNGVDGQQVSHNSTMGQTVANLARSSKATTRRSSTSSGSDPSSSSGSSSSSSSSSNSNNGNSQSSSSNDRGNDRAREVRNENGNSSSNNNRGGNGNGNRGNGNNGNGKGNGGN